MTRLRPRPSRSRARPHPRSEHIPPPAIPLRSPWTLLTLLAGAACVLLSVTYHLYDTDFWQHLLVGRVIWEAHGVPTTQLWTWPTHGAPDVNASWGFEALVWRFWQAGGLLGLFAWRWLVTLATFCLLWLVARRLGARGLVIVVVLALAAAIYRQRVQIRPETLVAVLLALELWILETRRQGGPDRSWWLVPIAWAWINVHISYHVGFAILGVFLLEAHLRAWRRGARAPATGQDPPVGARPARLWIVLALALGASFLNPFGGRALWQPFEYLLVLRHEAAFRMISELQPIDWSLNARNGLVLMLPGWPLLALWRTRRLGPDPVELLLCALFTVLAFQSQRFLGFYALVAAPYLARDFDAWVNTRAWPRWTRPFPARAALAGLGCLMVTAPELARSDPPFGIGLDTKMYPIAACDFVAREGVRGRALNQLRSGGYLVWRFWPERDRLPFVDSHLAGTPEIRRGYYQAMVREEGWRALDERHDFEWALLSRPPPPGDRLQDFLDADTTRWSLVFVDDAAAVYAKRRGPSAPVAERLAFHELGAGETRLLALAAACVTDSALRARVRPELERVVATSPQTALARSFLANLAMADGQWDRARAELERALAIDPRTPEAHLRLATVALATQRPREAIAALEHERKANRAVRNLDLRLGFAYEQLGDSRAALAAYRRELVRDPDNPLVLERIRALEKP